MSRHDKDYNSSVKLSAYADLMLDRIDTCISDKISKNVTRLASAIVTKVNSDGSVNIRLPSEDNTEFTKIQNQCPYELKIGDAVELTLKNGSFNNCWVSAKHGMGTRATSEGSSGAYVLPVATATQLGGIKVGAGLVISNGVLSVTGGGTADAVEWKNVLNTPTTLAGYGITDARINSGTITLGGNSIVPLTASSNLDATKLVGNVPSATKAIQDGNGDVIVDTYAKKTDIPSLSGYATQTWVQNQGYLKEHQSLAEYALKTEIPIVPNKVSAFENDAGYLTSHQSLKDYATKSWVQNQGYLTQHQDISGLATKLELQTVEDKIPTIPTKVSAFENDVGYLTQHQSLANYALKSELPKNVSDLTNDAKYITSSGAPVQSVNGKTGAVSLTANDVGALPNTTTIPVVNNAKLTIQQNGTEVGNFTANSAVDKTVNITVPTKLSELEDDSSFAKTSELPTKTSELENDSGYITSSDIPSIPVTTVNGKTGAVVLNATDVQALPNTTVIPTTTSQLTNNSGYITSAGAPVQSVNGKIGAVSLTANDVGALPNTTTIPVVNNAKLTIQKNSKEIDSFTANASVDKIINIEVPTKASDIKAISTDDISQILGNSETKVPSEKAVAQAMSAAGYGDMLKANYATKSDSIVDKSYADENGDNIASTYLPKFKLLNNTDANSLITSQICVIGAGNTNLPDEATGSVLFVAGDGTNAFQIIVVYATNTLNHRAYKDGAWTIWRNTEAKTSTDSATNFDAYGLGFITEE